MNPTDFDDPRGSADLLQQLSRLEAELHHPGVPATQARLEALLHPAFHEVGRSGRPYSRETVVAYLGTQTAPAPVDAGGYAVHRLGPDAALLTYRSARRAADGSAAEAALRSSVWLRTDRGWQLFYHQGTPAASAA